MHCKVNKFFLLLVWEKQNETPVCYEAKDDKHGTFTVQRNGKIKAFKLEHVSGSLSCSTTGCESYWGMNGHIGPEFITTFITDTSKNIVSAYGITSNNYKSFSIPGYDHQSNEIIMNVHGPKVTQARTGDIFWVWYGEDLFNGPGYEPNNHGVLCINVYAGFTL